MRRGTDACMCGHWRWHPEPRLVSVCPVHGPDPDCPPELLPDHGPGCGRKDDHLCECVGADYERRGRALPPRRFDWFSEAECRCIAVDDFDNGIGFMDVTGFRT